MKKFLLAVFCLAGLLGCMNDDSTIDESSIVITRGNIRDVYVEAYVDANAKGLGGVNLILPNKSTGFNKTHDRGYTMLKNEPRTLANMATLLLFQDKN